MEIIELIILYIVVSLIGLYFDKILTKIGNADELPDNPMGKILSCFPLANFAWIPAQLIMIIYYYLNIKKNDKKN